MAQCLTSGSCALNVDWMKASLLISADISCDRCERNLV